jgi:hypothetical protein
MCLSERSSSNLMDFCYLAAYTRIWTAHGGQGTHCSPARLTISARLLTGKRLDIMPVEAPAKTSKERTVLALQNVPRASRLHCSVNFFSRKAEVPVK